MESGSRAQRVRDLLIIRAAGGAGGFSGPGDIGGVAGAGSTLVVIGCDSCGGIGPKDLDVVRVPAYIVGRFTSRVAVMEVLASGAKPVALVSTLCCEPDPTGVEVDRGIADELAEAGLDGDVTVTGSTEKNVAVAQTGLGVTVIGFAARESLRFGRSIRGDEIVCVGVPKVGHEVRLDDPEIADIPALRRLLGLDSIHEVIPAGSRGVLHEAQELAVSGGLALELRERPGLEDRKSVV